MAITIEFSPEVESQLEAAAARQGQDATAFAKAAVEEKLQSVRGASNGSSSERLTLEEEERLLDELAAGSENLPVLPPEANSREWIYRDHD